MIQKNITYLTASLSSGGTSFTTAASIGSLAVGGLWVMVGSEVIRVHHSPSANTWSGLIRANPVDHLPGERVVPIVNEFGSRDVYHKPVPHGLFDKDGNVLDSSDFTWINQDGATVQNNPSGSMTISALDPGGDANELRILTRPLPSGDFTLRAALIFQPHRRVASSVRCGIGTVSTGGKFMFMTLYLSSHVTELNDRIMIQKWDDEETFSNTVVTRADWIVGRSVHYLRVDHDGTRLYWYYSMGGPWTFIHSGTRTAHGAGTLANIAVFVDAGGSAVTNDDTFLTISAWEETDNS